MNQLVESLSHLMERVPEKFRSRFASIVEEAQEVMEPTNLFNDFDIKWDDKKGAYVVKIKAQHGTSPTDPMLLSLVKNHSCMPDGLLNFVSQQGNDNPDDKNVYVYVLKQKSASQDNADDYMIRLKKQADDLDDKGLFKEANHIDELIKMISRAK